MFSPFGKPDPTDDTNDQNKKDELRAQPETSSEPKTDDPVVDVFGDEPINQIVSDPNTFQNRVRLQCSKCKFTFEGNEVPDKCPKCGASKEYFIDL